MGKITSFKGSVLNVLWCLALLSALFISSYSNAASTKKALPPSSATSKLPSITSVPNATITIAAIEDPPRTSMYLPDQGELIYLLQAIAREAEYELEVKFMSWKEALNGILFDPEINAMVGMYFSALRNEMVLFSAPITLDKIGFAHRIDFEFKWENLTDLTSYKIGLVAGYSYEDKFDQLAFSKRLDTEFYPDDESLLTALINGKIQLAAISERNYDYLLQRPEISKLSHKLVFHPKLLTERRLHIALKRNDNHETIRVRLNNAINKVNLEQLIQNYWLQLKPQTHI